MQKRNSRLFFGYNRPFKPFYGHRSLLNPPEGEIRGQGVRWEVFQLTAIVF